MLRRAALASSLLAAHAALAQAPASAPVDPPPAQVAREALQRLQDPPADGAFRVSLGLGALMFPVQSGGRTYTLLPWPLLDLRWGRHLFASTVEGLGVNAVATRALRVGLAAHVDLGRLERRDPRLAGWGAIDPALDLRLFASAAAGPVRLSATLRRHLGGSDGALAEFGAVLPLPLSARLLVPIGASLTWMDARYARAFYGLTEEQAGIASALDPALATPYAAGAGLRDAALSVGFLYRLDEQWTLRGRVALSRLLGDAEESPISQQPGALALFTFASYTF